MLKYIKKEKPDLVHYHGIYGGRYYYPKFFNITAYFCKTNRIPFFGWYHTGELAQGKRFPLLVKPIKFAKIRALRRCAGITSINHPELDRLFNPLSEYYYGIDFSGIPHCHTPNTVDRKMFYPVSREEALRKTGLNKNKKYILMVSRLLQEKGLHHLLNVMPALAQRFPDVHLLIVGEFISSARGYEHQIMQQVSDLRIKEKITFVGRVEHNEGLLYYYNAADVFVLPTLKETFGGVNLEAIACGTPAVATECGEIPYYLSERVGIVIPKGNEEAILNALTKVLLGQFHTDEEEREKILEKYDYRSAASLLRDWYREVLNKRKN